MDRNKCASARTTGVNSMNDISAFPKLPITRESNGEILYQSDGMTLRDYFAAKAMQGFLTGDYDLYAHEVVQRAYEIADAMLTAREKK